MLLVVHADQLAEHLRRLLGVLDRPRERDRPAHRVRVLLQRHLLIAVDPEQKFAIRLLCLEHAVRASIELHRLNDKFKDILAQHLIASVLIGSRSDDQESYLFKLSLASSNITINCETSPMGPFRSAVFPPEKRGQFNGSLDGQLRTIRLKKGNELYESISEINSLGICETFNDYLANSAQRLSILELDQNKHGRGHGFGLWIEKLPQTTEADWRTFTNRFSNRDFFQSCLASSSDPDKIVTKLFDEGIQILAITKPKLTCSCNKDRIINALSTLPQKDLLDLFMDKSIETQCDYCHKVWTLTDADLKDLLPINSTQH